MEKADRNALGISQAAPYNRRRIYVVRDCRPRSSRSPPRDNPRGSASFPLHKALLPLRRNRESSQESPSKLLDVSNIRHEQSYINKNIGPFWSYIKRLTISHSWRVVALSLVWMVMHPQQYSSQIVHDNTQPVQRPSRC